MGGWSDAQDQHDSSAARRAALLFSIIGRLKPTSRAD
jgi:hypothetical protein